MRSLDFRDPLLVALYLLPIVIAPRDDVTLTRLWRSITSFRHYLFPLQLFALIVLFLTRKHFEVEASVLHVLSKGHAYHFHVFFSYLQALIQFDVSSVSIYLRNP